MNIDFLDEGVSAGAPSAKFVDRLLSIIASAENA